ncbi:MAG: hypothetical protein EAX95_00615 [Candidatus Thorarchaeota archaeon]|nr:hypothetical protein [Candidatus Thorarchaeota archaeon]
MKPIYSAVGLILLQIPFDPTFPSPFVDILDISLNIMLALVIRGYLIFVLVGFMVYVTGISDGLGKLLVGMGVVLYVVGPILLDLFTSMIGLEAITIESATTTWLSLIGMTDAEVVGLVVLIGDMVAVICVLAGAILYFTPSSSDLKSRGHSLVVRALMFAPVLAFFHVTPWI